jgi:competence protein ComEC
MVSALVALAVGIVLADTLRMPLWVAATGVAVTLAAACRWHKAPLILLAVFMTGATAITLRRSGEEVPSHTTDMELQIGNVTHESDTLHHFNAHITAYAEDNTVRRCDAGVKVTAPTSAPITAGDRVVIHTHIRPFNPTTDYGGYMLRRGVVGSIYLHPDNIISHNEHTTVGEWLQAKALNRIERLPLSPDVRSVATSISIGRQSLIHKEQRRHYTLAGGAHLLAVSGMHVGFLFVLINLLLLPIAGLRRGAIWRSVLACVAIWAYASMANFSPSVVRAATMLSIFQLSLMAGSGGRSLNVLCFTAFVMLLWDGRTLYDAGLLLSWLAVAAIVEWGVPMLRGMRRKRSDEEKIARMRFRLQHPIRGWMLFALRYALGWVASAAVVSLVANIITLPMVSLLFGEVTLWGIMVGPAMVALCSVATTLMLGWIIMPLQPLTGAVGWCIEGLVGTMNAIAEWCASNPSIAFTLKLNPTSCALIYLAFALITLALWSRERK